MFKAVRTFSKLNPGQHFSYIGSSTGVIQRDIGQIANYNPLFIRLASSQSAKMAKALVVVAEGTEEMEAVSLTLSLGQQQFYIIERLT